MKNTIPIEAFGPNQFIYFDIKRLMQLEQLTGKAVQGVIASGDISLNFIINGLAVGMRQHYKDGTAVWTERVQKHFDNGGSLDDLGIPLLRAIMASGIFGKPEADITEDDTAEGPEKNAPEAAELTE